MTGRARVFFGVIALVAMLVSLSIVGCKRSSGGEPRRDGAVMRVVSLTPSTTEAVYAIGAGDRLVGRSRYCNYPAAVEKLPVVGGYIDPSFEAILALSPDLVVGARGPAGAVITDRLAARGIATYFPEAETFAQIDAMLLGLGEQVGRATEARAYVATMHAREAEIERAVAERPRPKVLLLFGLAPISVAGPSSFADEMLRRAGANNAVTDGGAYPTIGVEHVLALDPDVIVNAAIAESMGKHKLGKETPGWTKLRAVREGKIIELDDESVLRPGPRLAEGLAVLARAIHPEAFAK